ncbi:hypothetical protein [Bacillus thuringiensis]|uniref:hypothetical protein n=1 Tax=Bacillus thuringiensis TaxID=1428 RepID=UPI000BF8FA70|nr:hypothetical protein [Bacillus thuringiensis]PFD55832.1 hypothetical protein CN274_24830 [Bacillus thuringiensis]
MINTFYQANLFADFREIDVTPNNIMRLMNTLKDFGLLPSTYQELNPAISSTPITRPKFSSINEEWVISIGSNCINIDKNPVDAVASNMTDIQDFIRIASHMLQLIIEEFGKNGKRVSLVTNALLDEMPEEQLNSIYNRIVSNPLEFYKENIPMEWNVRSANRVNYTINNAEEQVNVITNMGRVKGRMLKGDSVVDIERISLEFDINTVASNEDTRLSGSSVSKFLQEAVETRGKIISQVERVINE